MNGLEDRLAVIGFGLTQRRSECWRIERIGPPRRRRAAYRLDPADSCALSVWLGRLGEQRPEAFRICRASKGE